LFFSSNIICQGNVINSFDSLIYTLLILIIAYDDNRIYLSIPLLKGNLVCYCNGGNYLL
jgi:hypothetical protein